MIQIQEIRTELSLINTMTAREQTAYILGKAKTNREIYLIGALFCFLRAWQLDPTNQQAWNELLETCNMLRIKPEDIKGIVTKNGE